MKKVIVRQGAPIKCPTGGAVQDYFSDETIVRPLGRDERGRYLFPNGCLLGCLDPSDVDADPRRVVVKEVLDC